MCIGIPRADHDPKTLPQNLKKLHGDQVPCFRRGLGKSERGEISAKLWQYFRHISTLFHRVRSKPRGSHLIPSLIGFQASELVALSTGSDHHRRADRVTGWGLVCSPLGQYGTEWDRLGLSRYYIYPSFALLVRLGANFRTCDPVPCDSLTPYLSD